MSNKFQTFKEKPKEESTGKKYLNNSERLTLVEQNLMILQELFIQLSEYVQTGRRIKLNEKGDKVEDEDEDDDDIEEIDE